MIVPLLLMAGCAGMPEPGPRAENTSKAVAKNPFAAVQKGMTAEQVRNLVGDPKQIKPLNTAGLTGEVWIYEHQIATLTQEVGVGTRDVPFTNPITGIEGITQEMVMGDQSITVYESVEFLMLDGRLIEWKRKQWEDRRLNSQNRI